MPTTDWTTDDVDGTVRAVDTWVSLAMQGVADGDVDAALLAEIERLRTASGAHRPLSERAVAADALVDALSALGRWVHRQGHGPTSHPGELGAIHVSNGGVPKQPVAAAAIGWRGVDGDRQASRRHHGRVWQAVSLWSGEVIAMLQAQGHPIAPGSAGENLTVRNIDFAELRPGTRLAVGDALIEITVPALPCKKNAQWFLDGDFNRIHHERNPGWSRLYARVVEPGSARTGDSVVVEP